MAKILENVATFSKLCSDAAELYKFYQDSELVKMSVSISDLFYRYAKTSNEYDKKHIRLDINDLIFKYKNTLQEIGVNITDFTW